MKVTTTLTASMLAAAALLGGCNMSRAEPQPARLTNMSPTVKAELQQAIIELIGGEPVKLADNAFAASHKLFIEQVILRDSRGLPIMGRHQQPAILLELQKQNEQCLLSHPASQNRVLLRQATCQLSATIEK